MKTNNKGINYKVDIDNGDSTIYFQTNAPNKITKLLLNLWFKSERDYDLNCKELIF